MYGLGVNVPPAGNNIVCSDIPPCPAGYAPTPFTNSSGQPDIICRDSRGYTPCWVKSQEDALANAPRFNPANLLMGAAAWLHPFDNTVLKSGDPMLIAGYLAVPALVLFLFTRGRK